MFHFVDISIKVIDHIAAFASVIVLHVYIRYPPFNACAYTVRCADRKFYLASSVKAVLNSKGFEQFGLWIKVLSNPTILLVFGSDGKE